MKKYKLVILDRYDSSKSNIIPWESDKGDMIEVFKDVVMDVWDMDEWYDEVKLGDNFVSMDLEEESYILIPV